MFIKLRLRILSRYKIKLSNVHILSSSNNFGILIEENEVDDKYNQHTHRHGTHADNI